MKEYANKRNALLHTQHRFKEWLEDTEHRVHRWIDIAESEAIQQALIPAA